MIRSLINKVNPVNILKQQQNFGAMAPTFNFSTLVQDFQLYKGKYLIPKAPQKTPTVYNLYMAEKRELLVGGIKGAGFKQVVQSYKDPNQDKQLKHKLETIVQKRRMDQEVLVENYNKKFIQPIKKSKSAFQFFFVQYISQNKNLKVTEAMKQAAVEYKKLSKAQQEVYEKQAKTEHAKAQKLQHAYEAKFKVPFCKLKTPKTIIREEFPKLDFKEATKKYNELTEDEQQAYIKKAETDYENQKKSFLEFLKKHKISEQQYAKVLKQYNKKIEKMDMKNQQE